MSPISELSVEGYRCFADRTPLKLAPLTLLYGWNNAGKSSLLRLLPMLADSVSSTATVPLEPGRVFDSRATLRDLIWKGADVAELGLELTFSRASGQSGDRIYLKLAHDKLSGHALIREAKLWDVTGKLLIEALHKPASAQQPWTQAQHYEVRRAGRRTKGMETVVFRGLLPDASQKAPWAGMRELLQPLQDAVWWLRSVRGPIDRLPKEKGGAPAMLQPDGAGVEQVLRYRPEIRTAVSAWYERRFARRIEIQPASADLFRVLLSPMGRTALGVDLVDSGYGLQQVLPVLVAAEMARGKRSGVPPILAVEEPEANLHDNAQRWLGEYLCQVAGGDRPPTIVLETHSQILMLAIQLAVATGQLPRNRVQIYWLSTLEDGRGHADPVNLNDRGEPEGRWPSPVFADRLTLSRELMAQQLEMPPK